MIENDSHDLDEYIEKRTSVEVPEAVQKRMRSHLEVLRAHMENDSPPKPDLWMLLRETTSGRLLAISTPVAAVLAVLLLMALQNGTGSLAFADVMQRLVNLHSYSCQRTTTYADGQTHSVQVLRLDLHHRREIDAEGKITVFDLASNPARILSINPQQKIATLKKVEHDDPRSDPDIVRMVENMMGGNTERLGERIIAGETTIGFRSLSEYNDITVWANVETALPAEVAIQHMKTGTRIVFRDFEFDVNFDPTLFETTLPEGYDDRTPSPAYSTTQMLLYDDGRAVTHRIHRLDLQHRREEREHGIDLIFDLSGKDVRILQLDKQAKTAKLLTVPGRGPASDPDMIALAKEISAQSGNPSLETMNGREWEVAEGTVNRETWKVWMDPETELPYRIEAQQDGRVLILSDFDYAPNFKEGFFATEVPSGYEEKP